MDVIAKYKIQFGKRRIHLDQFKAMASAIPLLDGFMSEFRSFYESESLLSLINLHDSPDKGETHYITQGMMLARISYDRTLFYQEDDHFYKNADYEPDLIIPTQDFKEIILEWRKHLHRNLFLEDQNLTLQKHHLDFYDEYINERKIHVVKSTQPSHQLSGDLAVFLNNTHPDILSKIILHIEARSKITFEPTTSDHQLSLTISEMYSSIENISQKVAVHEIFTYELREILREWLIYISYGQFRKLKFI
ncbi:hypothetical protein [Chryseobacterium sp. MEBOG07]|uniref:hypothetical protein n=1 Tax=Chryseobacterium sp. MEBOG07 TaxID=2879939 RepID=UPI001F3A55AB|nr:hypothetical protein [Chryseobacterium sp. MEBOG07]UKB78043.1 hypothetical protein LF886_16345 [Chryseobacterium sp. MEBOG07]